METKTSALQKIRKTWKRTAFTRKSLYILIICVFVLFLCPWIPMPERSLLSFGWKLSIIASVIIGMRAALSLAGKAKSSAQLRHVPLSKKEAYVIIPFGVLGIIAGSAGILGLVSSDLDRNLPWFYAMTGYLMSTSFFVFAFYRINHPR